MHYFKLKILIVAFASFLVNPLAYSAIRLDIAINNGEYWWIGIVNHGSIQPLKNGYSADLNANLYGNQAQPLLLSSKGRLIWSEDPFSIEVRNDTLKIVKTDGVFVFEKAGETLREAYVYASKHFFPASLSHPDEFMFRKPQYNTWIELLYDQNQEDILNYASQIIINDLPAGVIMIDDNWQEDYGTWTFHPDRFPDPKAMIDSLHVLGFKVMLWVCPFISPDSFTGRFLAREDLLLKDIDGETKIVHWWNGYSSLLDLSNPGAGKWFDAQLEYLMDEFGVDGFKFDAGDPEYYVDCTSYEDISPNRHSELFSLAGIDYSFNEYRATWKAGGQPLAQRLRDKGHNWNDLHTLIPNILLQGIMGYPFTCPDMIGGGEMGSFLDLDKIDQDLIVRSAQCHVFMPMMQFSVAPWRVLDEEHFQAVKQAVDLRMQYSGQILELVKQSALTGEPIVRYLEYEFPKAEYEHIIDQFMLGENLMIAPFLDQEKDREILIPKGKWLSDTGEKIKGPTSIIVENDLFRIPHFKKLR